MFLFFVGVNKLGKNGKLEFLDEGGSRLIDPHEAYLANAIATCTSFLWRTSVTTCFNIDVAVNVSGYAINNISREYANFDINLRALHLRKSKNIPIKSRWKILGLKPS